MPLDACCVVRAASSQRVRVQIMAHVWCADYSTCACIQRVGQAVMLGVRVFASMRARVQFDTETRGVCLTYACACLRARF